MEFLRHLNKKGGVQGIDLGLRRVGSIARSLDIFGPSGHIPTFIHVAGTNGKGSVCAKVEHALCHILGKTTGSFTSPHLRTLRERFRLNGQMISYEELTGLAGELQSRVEELHEEEPTYFEALTLMSFMLFKSREVDVAVVEAGEHVSGCVCSTVVRYARRIGRLNGLHQHTAEPEDLLHYFDWIGASAVSW